MVKKVLKYFLYRFVGNVLYPIIRIFYVPPVSVRRKLRFIGRYRVKTEEGKRFRLFNNAFHLENHIFWLGIDRYPWEQFTRRIWKKLCRHSDIIFDIGANSGIYAILAKVYNNGAAVYAFEPQPNVFNVLDKNNRINGFDIRCECMALSDMDGRLPFYNYGPDTFTTENTTAGSLNKDWVTREQSSIEVEVSKLSTYIEKNNIERIDLMKIDVETLEYNVLLGYGKYLDLHQPIIVLEVQNREIGQGIASLTKPENYAFFGIEEGEGLRRVQELGALAGSLNYLLCPNSKVDLVREFLVPGSVNRNKITRIS